MNYLIKYQMLELSAYDGVFKHHPAIFCWIWWSLEILRYAEAVKDTGRKQCPADSRI
ncbi:hypothetical protein SAMN05192539_1003392 [Paraburkholderia diazotrophica]|uniref:Uncharacterized protein n=1 Tax=Paraburkholderia diazotrophica TaxID=667676 RepID=A0A1H6T6F2_9BURK|nr:hypothetical protein SAMN05192539_1003392 [Paraburkholderia diazotrophica]